MSTSGHPLHGWAGAGRFFWSFLWRQALALFVSSMIVGFLIGTLRKFGWIRPVIVFDAMPFITTGLVAFSCIASFRSLLSVYDVRAHHGGSVEQDRRHRR